MAVTTHSFKYKPTTAPSGTEDRVLACSHTTDDCHCVINASGQIGYYVSGVFTQIGTATVSLNEQYAFIIEHDDIGNGCIYLNGQKIGCATNFPTSAINQIGNFKTELKPETGRKPKVGLKPRDVSNIYTRPCCGIIDEYARFNRALSASEVVDLSQSGTLSKVYTLADYKIALMADDGIIATTEKPRYKENWRSIWDVDQRTSSLPTAIASITVNGSYKSLATAANDAGIWTPTTNGTPAYDYYQAVESWRQMYFVSSGGGTGFLLTAKLSVDTDISAMSPTLEARQSALMYAEDALRSAIMTQRQSNAETNAIDTMTEYADDLEAALRLQTDHALVFTTSATDPSTGWTAEDKLIHRGDYWRTSTTAPWKTWSGTAWGTVDDAQAQAAASAAASAASTAQTTANNAANAAATAQSTATTASNNATTALDTLSDIASDSKFTPVEKQSALNEWNIIAAEKSVNVSQATSFGVSSTDYANAFQALANYLNNGATWSSGTPAWLASLTTTQTIVGTDFRATWKLYYDKRTELLNAVAAKAKTLADTAQSTANVKRRVFTSTPTVPYDVGDLWVAGSTGDIKKCKTARATGSYTASEWEIASKYTDDTVAVTKSRTFIQTTAPSTGMQAGDYWLDSDDSYKPYVYKSGAWAVDRSMQAAIDAQGAADDAQDAADAAQGDATNALNAIGNITSDNVLSSAEKPEQRKQWNIISAEKTGIVSQATTFSVSSTAYTNAFQALATYLNAGTTYTSGVPSWLSDANLATNTTIVGSTYRTNWETLYSARTALLNAISAKAKTLADTAQSTANVKRRVFTSTPTVPYDVGDLWVAGSTGDIKKCKTARATGSYTASEWEIASKYTDDTVAVTKSRTFIQTTAPSTGMQAGDYWLDSDDNYKPYVYKSGAWSVDRAMESAINAQTTADKKTTLWATLAVANSDGAVAGDMFMDSSLIYRCLTSAPDITVANSTRITAKSFGNLASAPVGAIANDRYYNTTNLTWYRYTGSAWTADGEALNTVTVTYTPKYLGRYEGVHPASYNNGDWWLVYDTDDSPIVRGFWYSNNGTPARVSLLSAEAQRKYKGVGLEDVLYASNNGYALLSGVYDPVAVYGVSVMEYLAVNQAFIAKLMTKELKLVTDGVIYGGTRYNADGTIANRNVTGFHLDGDTGKFQGTIESDSYYNTLLGTNAGINLSTGSSYEGSRNTITGYSAGVGAIYSAYDDDSFFGYMSGFNCGIGSKNSFFGSLSGYKTDNGNNNSFFGYRAGYSNVGGSSNNFFGDRSGYSNISGINNSFFGGLSGYTNEDGEYNSFFGRGSGFKNKSGIGNSFFGANSGYENLGYANSFFGSNSGYNNVDGNNNAFFGNQSGYINSSGDYNSLFGSNAGVNVVTQNNVVCVGYNTTINTSASDYQMNFNNRVRYFEFPEGTLYTTVYSAVSPYLATYNADGRGATGVGAMGVYGHKPVYFIYRPNSTDLAFAEYGTEWLRISGTVSGTTPYLLRIQFVCDN